MSCNEFVYTNVVVHFNQFIDITCLKESDYLSLALVA